MSLLKKHYQNLTKIYNVTANTIRQLQQTTRDRRENTDSDENLLSKISDAGKIAAYEECYNLLRQHADIVYASEHEALDSRVAEGIQILKNEIYVLNMYINQDNNDKESINSQFKMLNMIIERLESFIKISQQ